MYAVAAETNGAEVVNLVTSPDRGWLPDVAEAAKVLEERTDVKLVFACSPGNPTGTLIPVGMLRKLAELTAGRALLVIDEAYIEFTPANTAVELLKDYPHVVIIRTLSKAFALAGLRCGFLLSSPAVIGMLRKVIAPYPIPVPCADIAAQALSPESVSLMHRRAAQCVMRKCELEVALEDLDGVEAVYPSASNFLLLRVLAPAARRGGYPGLGEDNRGRPLEERMALAGVAVDAVMDSVSVKTTFREVLAEKGILFCSISEALRDFPELVKKYLGSVVPYTDNFYAALNAAVFSDGSFCYIPKGVRCPMELSTYFRINAAGTGQFERTLIVADEGAYVSYLEGCTAPQRDENQLHAAVVEIVVERDAEVKYSTVQNWYPGDKQGRGGIYNFVTKRGICRENARLSWTQVETGSAITWKYPSCILAGDNSVGEFYSVAMTNNFQQADTGTKMIHIGRNTRSRIVSKGISAGRSENSYRGMVRVAKGAENARNYSQCDSLLIGDKCGAHTFPVIDVRNPTGVVEHEATTSKISDDQLFYCNQRGLSTEDAVGLIVNGYAREVLAKLPMEFAVEAQKLLALQLEGSVG